jgi:starch phosphorylase
MFRQEMHDGFQHENPDYWLNFGNPWEIERPNIAYPIKFYGHVSTVDVDNHQVFKWDSGEEVTAVAYDTPIPGWNTPNTINLRLWSAKPSREFDLESFNTGDYVQAILAKQRAETISAVLYPDDRTYQGKELRLKQQFFMVSATLQDIIRRFLVTHDASFDAFPEKVALQLNDTHPTIGVPELMRLLMDEHGLGWTKAWDITTRVFSFTNHTVLPEALEKWPVDLVENVLPRHMQIIYDINWRFTQELRGVIGDDYDKIGRMSIIEEGEGYEKSVRMAHLALVASHTVNGVAAIHSELIKTTIFREFHAVMPEKFQNKTNGVTQRRWLAFCNPALSELITETLGTSAWVKELDLLQGLREYAEDPAFQKRWGEIKRENKQRLADLVFEKTGTRVPTDALFDIQVKRIHEYKRQLLNVFAIIHRYNALKAMSKEERLKQVPRVCIVGGKAAPGYDMAKRIIKLVSAVGETVNKDPEIGDLLKVVFLPDYNVSSAEVIVPGAELSQHISTAGTEASGTVEHEVCYERVFDHRHDGRRERGDRGRDRRGEHVHLRAQSRRGSRVTARARVLQRPGGVLQDHRPDPQRGVRVGGLFPPGVRRGVRRRGLLPARQRLRVVPRGAAARGRGVRRPGALEQDVHLVRRGQRQVQQRPHDKRVRRGHLGRQAVQAPDDQVQRAAQALRRGGEDVSDAPSGVASRKSAILVTTRKESEEM